MLLLGGTHRRLGKPPILWICGFAAVTPGWVVIINEWVAGQGHKGVFLLWGVAFFGGFPRWGGTHHTYINKNLIFTHKCSNKIANLKIQIFSTKRLGQDLFINIIEVILPVPQHFSHASSWNMFWPSTFSLPYMCKLHTRYFNLTTASFSPYQASHATCPIFIKHSSSLSSITSLQYLFSILCTRSSHPFKSIHTQLVYKVGALVIEKY